MASRQSHEHALAVGWTRIATARQWAGLHKINAACRQHSAQSSLMQQVSSIRTIADEEPCTRPIAQCRLMPLASVYHSLQLQAAQPPLYAGLTIRCTPAYGGKSDPSPLCCCHSSLFCCNCTRFFSACLGRSHAWAAPGGAAHSLQGKPCPPPLAHARCLSHTWSSNAAMHAQHLVHQRPAVPARPLRACPAQRVRRGRS